MDASSVNLGRTAQDFKRARARFSGDKINGDHRSSPTAKSDDLRNGIDGTVLYSEAGLPSTGASAATIIREEGNQNTGSCHKAESTKLNSFSRIHTLLDGSVVDISHLSPLCQVFKPICKTADRTSENGEDESIATVSAGGEESLSSSESGDTGHQLQDDIEGEEAGNDKYDLNNDNMHAVPDPNGQKDFDGYEEDELFAT